MPKEKKNRYAFDPDSYLQWELEASFYLKILQIKEKLLKQLNQTWNQQYLWIDLYIVMLVWKN